MDSHVSEMVPSLLYSYGFIYFQLCCTNLRYNRKIAVHNLGYFENFSSYLKYEAWI